MLTKKEFEKYKCEVKKFIERYPKQSLVPDHRVRQMLNFFLVILEDDYTIRD
jgi:hypothetical protein